MEQRVSVITLGVRDVQRARTFYEALGWMTRAAPGDDVVFFTQVGSLKARNIERDPRVAISITDHENPYVTAQLRGRVKAVHGAALEDCDVLVVLVDHDVFRVVPLAERAANLVYDTRGIWPDQPKVVDEGEAGLRLAS